MSPSIIYLGMDVHKDFVMMAVLPAEVKAPTRVERVANEPAALRRWFGRLVRQGEIRSCYEASGVGLVLQRQLTAWGVACDIIAPALIPTRPGHQRKHDKRDACELARLYRAGELVPIHLPTEAEERVRDLVRCREVFQRELLRARHFLIKFLTRRGLIYRDGHTWTREHERWLDGLRRDGALLDEDGMVVAEYRALISYVGQRREELDRQIATIALQPGYAPAVARLRCFRGIDTHAAMVLASEIGDWQRFQSPRQLMAYLGLVPREHSSGSRERRGAITKAGNSHCRHVLLQAAWSYRHVPTVGTALKLRQRGQPPDVLTHAWKAQHRLHKVFGRLTYRKRSAVAAVAVARQLVGFLWAVMQSVERPAACTLAQVA